MLTFDASVIAKTMGLLRALEEQIRQSPDGSVLRRQEANRILEPLLELQAALPIQADVTTKAIKEFRERLAHDPIHLTCSKAAELIEEIAVAIRRELEQVRMFYLAPDREFYFIGDLSAFGSDFTTKFPDAAPEFDEAGKCYALGRTMACIFHLMRAMEYGVRTVARSLGIPDPVKGGERNWGAILRQIKKELERRNSASPPIWARSQDRAFFDEIYVSLDIVRTAWRNTTMHVGTKYKDADAEDILISVRTFMKKLASRLDETGEPKA